VFQLQDVKYIFQFFVGDGAFADAQLPVEGVLVCGVDSLWNNKNISLFFHAKQAKEQSTQSEHVSSHYILQPFTSIILSLTFGTIKTSRFFFTQRSKGAKYAKFHIAIALHNPVIGVKGTLRGILSYGTFEIQSYKDVPRSPKTNTPLCTTNQNSPSQSRIKNLSVPPHGK
jgi:hypothetical protein